MEIPFPINSILLQSLALYVPLVFFAALWKAMQLGKWSQIAVLYSVVWCLAVIPLADDLAQFLGCWSYKSEIFSVVKIPASLWMGWAIFWGGCLSLLAEKIHPIFVVMIAILLDTFFMPMMKPVLLLEKNWFLGEIVMIAAVLIPVLFLAYITRSRKFALSRGIMISFSFVTLILVVIPLAASPIQHWSWTWMKIASLIATFVFLLPAVAAVWEFGSHGNGTPFPFDPPQKYVQTGIYRYMKNPMQISIVLSMLTMSVFWNQWQLVIAAISTIIYNQTFAKWSERIDLKERFGVDK